MSRKQHRSITPQAPMLVMRGLVNDKLEMRERMAVEAFTMGIATTENFDTISDMQGILVLAGSTSEKRKPAMTYAHEVLGPALLSIKDRYLKTGRMGASDEDIKVLRAFVSKYRDFWLRQPTELYEAASHELQKHYNEAARKAKEAA